MWWSDLIPRSLRLRHRSASAFSFQVGRNISVYHPGPCDTGSLHQFGDLFAPLATRSLSGKLSKIQGKLMKRKSITPEIISSAVEESMVLFKEAGVDETKRTELSRLLRRCLCCPDFKRCLRPDVQRSFEDTIGNDESSIPPGVDLEQFSLSTNRNRQGPSVGATLEPSASFPHLQNHPYTVYIYNLPLRVDEDCIRRALKTVGDPTDIFLYDTRGIPVVSKSLGTTSKSNRSKTTHTTSWMRFASPVNAIVRFSSEEEFSRASRLENKLFGIQCKSTDLSVDTDRAMLIEPAFPKTHLLISGFPKGMIWSEFKEYFESVSGGLVTLSEQQPPYTLFNGSDMYEQRLDLACPSFEVAFEVLKRSRACTLNPSIVTAFSRFRSRWLNSDKKFTDSVYFEINSES